MVFKPNNFGPLLDAIEDLRDASFLFVKRYQSNDERRASEASVRASACFDFIIGEFDRYTVLRNSNGTFAGTAFAAEMAIEIGQIVEPTTDADVQLVIGPGPGNGNISNIGRPSKSITLDKTLKKIKHREPNSVNFRIENGRHIFVVFPRNRDGCVEFDVQIFCDQCQRTVGAL